MAESSAAELEPLATDADIERNRAITLQKSLLLEEFIVSLREKPGATAPEASKEASLAEAVKAVRPNVQVVEIRV